MLIIASQGIVTYPERLLQENRLDLAWEIREAVDRIINSQIRSIVERVLDVRVVDFLSNTTIDRKITGTIAIFKFEAKDI